MTIQKRKKYGQSQFCWVDMIFKFWDFSTDAEVVPVIAQAQIGRSVCSQTRTTHQSADFFPTPPCPQLRSNFFAVPPFSLLTFFQMSDTYGSVQDVNAGHNGYPHDSDASFGQASTVPIIRKKLMGYVGFANLPNQVHRKSVRKGFQFTVMVVGTCSFPLF